MNSPCILWDDGQPLGPGPLALIAFPHCKQRERDGVQPALGIARNDATTVVLLPEQMGLFVSAHANSVMVCHNAAALHWCLHGYFVERGQDDAVQALWRLSRDARLHDVVLLDQAVRRFDGESMPPARTLAELVVKRAGMEIPADSDLVDRVAAELPMAIRTPDHELWIVLAQAAAALMQIFDQLLAEADAILAIVANTNRPAILPSSAPVERKKIRQQTKRFIAAVVARRKEQEREQRSTGSAIDVHSLAEEASACDVNGPSAIDYGPLGVGIEVQAEIARNQPKPGGYLVDPDELTVVREWCQRRFAEAHARLRADHRARGWLRRCATPTALDLQGMAKGQMQSLKVWLHEAGLRLCDIHGCPASIPLTGTKEPCTNPDAWGVWSTCDPILRGWRDLIRAAHQYRWAAGKATVRPVDPVTFCDSIWSVNALTLRPITTAAFRPAPGQVFIVGMLEGLKLRCLAFVCRRRWYSGNGRLRGYIAWQDHPIETVAAELFAYHARAMNEKPFRASGDAAQIAEASGPDQFQVTIEAHTHEEVVAGFHAFRQTRPQLYAHWVRLARGLLETLPLGLPAGSQRFLLAQDYGIDMRASDIEWLDRLIADKVVYELRGLLDDDTLDQLASRLGLPVHAIIDLLVEEEHVESANARIRNDLHHRRRGSPVVNLLAQAGHLERAVHSHPGKDLTGHWLRRAALTLSGRVLGPDYCAPSRRAEYLAAVEEVRIAVAYALVSGGFTVGAVHDEDFIVEVPHAEAADERVRERIRMIVNEAGRRLLGDLAPPCRLRRWDEGPDSGWSSPPDTATTPGL